MTAWLKTFRLPIVLLAGLLVVVSFKIVGHTNEALFSVLAVISIASATMVQNDLRDRWHDVKKNKVLALRKSKKFFVLAVILWIIALGVVFVGWYYNHRFGFLPLLALGAGLVYSEIRRVPMLPIIIVSLVSASPSLFPVFLGYNVSDLWSLFAATALLVFSREMIKDLEDLHIDGDYKWTLPLILGEFYSRWVISVVLVVMLFIVTFSLFVFIGIPLFLLAIILLLNGVNLKKVKLFLDLGAAATLISILLNSG